MNPEVEKSSDDKIDSKERSSDSEPAGESEPVDDSSKTGEGSMKAILCLYKIVVNISFYCLQDVQPITSDKAKDEEETTEPAEESTPEEKQGLCCSHSLKGSTSWRCLSISRNVNV